MDFGAPVGAPVNFKFSPLISDNRDGLELTKFSDPSRSMRPLTSDSVMEVTFSDISGVKPFLSSPKIAPTGTGTAPAGVSLVPLRNASSYYVPARGQYANMVQITVNGSVAASRIKPGAASAKPEEIVLKIDPDRPELQGLGGDDFVPQGITVVRTDGAAGWDEIEWLSHATPRATMTDEERDKYPADGFDRIIIRRPLGIGPQFPTYTFAIYTKVPITELFTSGQYAGLPMWRCCYDVKCITGLDDDNNFFPSCDPQRRPGGVPKWLDLIKYL